MDICRKMIFAVAGLLATVSTIWADDETLPQKLVGHGGPIKAITISADGKTALTASFDYSLIYWDISKPEAKILHRLLGHDNAVNDVAFLQGEKRAVSVSDDGSLAIWNLVSGQMLKRDQLSDAKILDVAVSPDGAYAAASVWDQTIRLYDLNVLAEAGEFIGHRGNVNSTVFSSDGSKLYSAAYDGNIQEWDVRENKFIRPIYRHGWGINVLERLDDDRLIFGSLDGTVGVVDIEKALLITTLEKSERPIQSIKLSRDNNRFAYADGAGVIAVFNAADGSRVNKAPATFGPIWDFDFLTDTNQIYHVGLDDFAARWQITPNKVGQIVSQFPRRFQVRDSKDPGALEFQRKCSVCHTLVPEDANRAGPTLYNVFGREAGTLPGYPYSDALLESKIIWNADTISRLFDDGPDVVTPGTKMPVQRLKSVTRRDALINFLKEATAAK